MGGAGVGNVVVSQDKLLEHDVNGQAVRQHRHTLVRQAVVGEVEEAAKMPA